MLVVWARSSWFASPRNARMSLMHDGFGNYLIAVNFLLSGLIPVSEMMCPENSVLPKRKHLPCSCCVLGFGLPELFFFFMLDCCFP